MSTEATTGTPTKRRHAPPPVRDLRPPKLKLPPGACDTHFHFLGPQREFPFNPNRNFVPDVDHDDSTIADWQQMQSALGLSRGLLLQSMMYYPSYELALHALCLMPKRLRAVVSPRAEITDGELEILTEAGVVGVRFTRATSPTIDDRLVHRTHELGWGMHYLLHDEDQMRGWRSQILKSPDKFVIEHLGNPPVEQGVNSGTFKFVLECIDTGRCWLSFRLAPPSRRRFPSPTCCRWSNSWLIVRPIACSGAQTGRIRNTGGRCRAISDSRSLANSVNTAYRYSCFRRVTIWR